MPFNSTVVGVLGGGQLGRMFVEAASRLNVAVKILDAESASAKKISNKAHITGSFADPKAVEQLAKSCDVVTIEIEHVDTFALEKVASQVEIQPSWKTIRTIQDKYAQKKHLRTREVALADFEEVQEPTVPFLEKIARKLGYPMMLKAKKQAYDGRGNYPVRSAADIQAGLDALKGKELYAERWAAFTKELAVMVVKRKSGEVLAFPTVETVHQDSVCKLVYAPAPGVGQETARAAQKLAREAVGAFDGVGVFGVEMFLLEDGSLLVNEIAPRPHNSGHYTIEACGMSQYDAHLRAILDLQIPEASLELERPAVMLNILGGSTPDSHLRIAEQALTIPRARIHLYDKGDARPGRKMGHITVTGASMNEVERTIHPLVVAVDKMRAERADIKADSKLPTGPKPLKQPLVSITTGSISDQDKLKACYDILEELGIPFEQRITSAHRTPDDMAKFAKEAERRGIRVIIAAAGGAAHLPGMVAAFTLVPVIGLPIKPTIGDGWDSLVSMTNMPRGEPVLTVGVNNATNAALGAAQILGSFDEDIRERVRAHRESAAAGSRANDAKLQEETEQRLKAMDSYEVRL